MHFTIFLKDTLFYFILTSSVIVALYSVYNLFLSFFGFKVAKKNYPIIQDQTRFLILIAAHNEETVIAATIKNLQNIQYDPALYDLIVVNDRSTDQTGQICDQYQIKHIDTAENQFPREGVGKPAGIQYALRTIGFEHIKQHYDLLMILDADNFVDAHILRELNSQWIHAGKPEAIQSYLDSKNDSSLIAKGYSYTYLMNNRFFQLAKYNLQLPNSIGGTGFVVRTDYLINQGGFAFQSLVEDLELEIQIVNSGGRIIWNHFAHIYDEKPDHLKPSIKQRFRWSKGHWFVAIHHSMNLFKKFLQYRRWKYIDQFIYLTSMSKSLQLFFVLFSLEISSMLTSIGNTQFILTTKVNIFNLFLLIYNVIFLPIMATHLDSAKKMTFKRAVEIFFALFYYAITFVFIQAFSVFFWKKQHSWTKTPHVKKEMEIK